MLDMKGDINSRASEAAEQYLEAVMFVVSRTSALPTYGSWVAFDQ
jgi:hypothetical protein